MILLGALLSLIGLDLNTGEIRGTLGILSLEDGIKIVILIIGFFGLAEVMNQLIRPNGESKALFNFKTNFFPRSKDWTNSIFPWLRGSVIGGFFGMLPGTGPAIASSTSYLVEKTISKSPEKFGKGAIEGVSGPEAANNSAAQTSIIPTLALGIPGDVAMIFVLSIMMIHGVVEGPTFFQHHEDIFWILIGSFLIVN
jgi:TctA family transporter